MEIGFISKNDRINFMFLKSQGYKNIKNMCYIYGWMQFVNRVDNETS